VQAYPSVVRCRTRLGESHGYRGWAHWKAGQPGQAAADLRRAVELWGKVPTPTPAVLFERGQALALLALLERQAKSGVGPAEARAFAEQAVATVREAVAAGWDRVQELNEPDFDALREREDFRKLFEELQEKAGKRREAVQEKAGASSLGKPPRGSE
jgi:hypothetical protein